MTRIRLGRRAFALCLVFAVSCFGLTLAQGLFAANPLANLFKRVEADPTKSYAVTDTSGDWLIMATVFRGDNAMDQAHALVLELRKSHALVAYTHEKVGDYTGQWEGNHVDRSGNKDRWAYAHKEIVREVAVLVGGYSGLEDENAIKTLKQVKEIVPTSVKFGPISGADGSSEMIQNWRSAVNQGKKRGPLGMAFLCTNPLLTKEHFQAGGLDKLVIDMNKEVVHSLLRAPGQYSVKIATFRGATLLDQGKVQAVLNGKDMVSKLQEAGLKAHLLTEALRAKGHEAYEFHDRHESMVCVGHFDSVGTPRTDGKTEINPAVLKEMEFFGPAKTDAAGHPTGDMQPKAITVADGKTPKGEPNLIRITLDLQPMPVKIPRQSIGGMYQR